MLWDTLEIKENEVVVIQNSNIKKFQKFFLYILPIAETVICAGIILNEDSNWKYLSIVGSVFFFLLYKYYYLPSQEIGNYILQIQQHRIIYVEPGLKYIIPLIAVAEVKDESVYFDFRGRGNSYWIHKIIVKIKSNHQIVQICDDDKEMVLKSTKNSPIIVEISEMNLRHMEHDKLVGYMLDIINDERDMTD